MSKGLQCRPSLLGHLCSCLMARTVDKLSWETQAHGEGQWGPPIVPDELRLCLKALVLASCPWRLLLGIECPLGRPVVPGDWGHYPRGHGVDQLSRVTRTRL